MWSLDNEVALVTGASRGIGAAVATHLAALGSQVVVNYVKDKSRADAVVSAIMAQKGRAIALKADVRSSTEIRDMVRTATEQLGPISILINNAGVLSDVPIAFLKEEEWHRVIDTSLTGAYNMIKTVSRGMTRQRRGRILNITSVAGVSGDAMRAHYSSAKAGLIGLTRAVARELAPAGITVNALAPGPVETEMTDGMPEAKQKRLLAAIPLGRMGRAEEIAAVCGFFVSSWAGYITGQIIAIDGGLRMKEI